MEAQMRKLHAFVVAIVAAAVIALGVKTIFFSAPKAEADSMTGSISTPSTFELHRNMKDLPVHEIENPM
jgi:hypothetical protein